ncbi:unnamed protein product [Phytophthora lilii]|uniref:Unnamed protein product n=1 Tax=Phytophthora lilii TaxID=2077276 RepID=A0A9W7D9G3_9STRA|nr:unnamed protein product [Phytophthora lilii]
MVTVGELKEVIKEKKPNDFKDIDADKLQLCLAKTEGGAWLDGAGAAAVALDERGYPQGCVQMDPTLWIKNPKHFGDNFQPGEDQVHVLVVVPKGVGDASAAPPAAMHRHPEHTNRDIDSSVPYSSLSWADVEPILPMEDFDLQAKAVPDKVVEQLHARLAQLRKLYGDIYTGKEAKRQLFIVAVIEAVCLMLGDVTILVKEDVIGKNVRVHGRFEFVLKRGRKRISIVEAKRDDIPQGIAQNVAGLEALCDVEGLERTFGIVTNYLEWVFISDDDETIRRSRNAKSPSIDAVKGVVEGNSRHDLWDALEQQLVRSGHPGCLLRRRI